MKLIISVTNMKEFRPVSDLIPSSRIIPYIQEAQQFYLKRMLGPALYVDFLARYDVPADGKYADYQLLLNGTTYAYGPQTLEHPGLIGYLSYISLSLLFNNNQTNLTRYGAVQKNGEGSDPIDWKGIAGIVAELRSNALALQDEIIRYLRINAAAKYPLFNYADGSAQQDTAVKFFDPNEQFVNFPTSNGGRTDISL